MIIHTLAISTSDDVVYNRSLSCLAVSIDRNIEALEFFCRRDLVAEIK